LILSGANHQHDHLYIYPNDCALDDSIRRRRMIGMRFTLAAARMT